MIKCIQKHDPLEKKNSMVPPLAMKMPLFGRAKGGNWSLLGAKSVKYPDLRTAIQTCELILLIKLQLCNFKSLIILKSH